MTSQILIVALGAAVAGFVQGLSGFAFGLVAMGIWAWTLDPALAGPLVVFGSLIGQLIAARPVLRGASPWRALPLVVGGICGVPIGVALLRYIDPVSFKACVGALLVLWCPVMLFAGDLPRISWGGRWADAAAGWVGGVMGGLGGLTGPAPILWGTLRGWDRWEQRVVFMIFNLCLSALVIVIYIVSGTIRRADLPLFGIMIPAMLLPSLAGFRLYHRIDDATFRRVILGLLTVTGAVLIVSSVTAWM
ncbi:MAG: sulfite exporter TauE/SafE family protein [Acetobacteraceae bacterium]|nr:sulfite exporter TauE/SafE family protein [Acetobacteraceae bacterium]